MRIGGLGAASGTTTKTLRFCEESGLLPQTQRAANGYRDHGPEALSRLDFIRRGRLAGLRLPLTGHANERARRYGDDRGSRGTGGLVGLARLAAPAGAG
jgi:DNA-binding transcriptional MerR regulator